jgi:hypothetical protein
MKKNGLSDSHINNTLKTNMLFSEFLGTDVSFYNVKSVYVEVKAVINRQIFKNKYFSIVN